MKTIKLTSSDSNQVQASTMEATEGACRATGVASMAGVRDPFISSPPDPRVSEKKGHTNY